PAGARLPRPSSPHTRQPLAEPHRAQPERACTRTLLGMRRVLLVACALAVLAMAGASASPAAANTITPVCSPSPTDCTGPWYTSNVSLSWTVDPGPANSAGCDPQLITQTSASGSTVTCSADWSDGDPLSGSPSVTIKVDTTD